MRVSLQKSKNRQFVYIVKDFYSNGKRTTKIMEKLGTVADLMEEKIVLMMKSFPGQKKKLRL